jgi:hypothetical protein
MVNKEIKRYFCPKCGNVQNYSKGNLCKNCGNKAELFKIDDNYSLNLRKKSIVYLINIFWFIFVFITCFMFIFTGDVLAGYIAIFGIIMWFVTFILILVYVFFNLNRTSILIDSDIRDIGYQKYGKKELKEQQISELKKLITEAQQLNLAKEKIGKWKSEGYDVTELEKMLEEVREG